MVGIISGAAGGGVISIIIRAVDQYSKEFSKIDKQLKQSSSKFQNALQGAKNLGIQYGVLIGAATGFAVSVLKSAIQSERAMQSFNIVVGETADKLLFDLRLASRGMVSDFALMDSANRAMALGIDKNNLPELLDIARVRAKVTGRTVTQAFEDISIGIGRQSRLILDNLGIIINVDEAYVEYAQTLGRTKDSLSELEKKQAVTNKVIKESANLMIAFSAIASTTDEDIQTLTATWANFKVAIGNAIKPTLDLAIQIAQVGQSAELVDKQIMDRRWAESLDAHSTGWRELAKEIEKTGKELDSYKANLLSGLEGPFADQVKTNEELAQVDKQIADEKVRLGRIGEEEDSKTLRNLENRRRLLLLDRDQQIANIGLARARIENEDAAVKGIETTTQSVLDNLPKQLEKWGELLGTQKENNVEMDMRMEKVETMVNFEVEQLDRILFKLNEIGEAYLEVTGKKKNKLKIGDFFGFGSFQHGGQVQQTGLALVHEGERVIPKNRNMSSNGGGISITIGNIYGVNSRDISRALLRELSQKITI